MQHKLCTFYFIFISVGMEFPRRIKVGLDQYKNHNVFFCFFFTFYLEAGGEVILSCKRPRVCLH